MVVAVVVVVDSVVLVNCGRMIRHLNKKRSDVKRSIICVFIIYLWFFEGVRGGISQAKHFQLLPL